MSEANPVGRPQEYTDERIAEITKKLKEYIAVTPLPFWCDFCYLNDVNHRRSKELQRRSEEFRETFAKLEAKEEQALLKGGLTRKFSESMCALILKNHREYAEKTDLNGKLDHGRFFDEIVRKAAALRAKKAAK